MPVRTTRNASRPKWYSTGSGGWGETKLPFASRRPASQRRSSPSASVAVSRPVLSVTPSSWTCAVCGASTIAGASFTAMTVALTVRVCGGALPSDSETVKLPAVVSLPSCRNEIRFAARSAWVKVESATQFRSTVPCTVADTVWTSWAAVLSGSVAERSVVVTVTASPSETVIAPSPANAGASFSGVTVAVTVRDCGAAVPSVNATVKLPSVVSVPSCRNATSPAARSAWVKVPPSASTTLFTRTVPRNLPVTV